MKGNRERGTQVAEFAIALPLIVLMALIAAEGANMFRVYQVVTNASREGARVAVLAWYSPAAMNQNAQSSCLFNASSLSSSNAVCQQVANYAQNNRLIGNGLQQCSMIKVNINQSYQPPTDSTPRYSAVSVICVYQLHWLPRLPFYSISSGVLIRRTTAFLNFY
jgi:hypothetical protein